MGNLIYRCCPFRRKRNVSIKRSSTLTRDKTTSSPYKNQPIKNASIKSNHISLQNNSIDMQLKAETEKHSEHISESNEDNYSENDEVPELENGKNDNEYIDYYFNQNEIEYYERLYAYENENYKEHSTKKINWTPGDLIGHGSFGNVYIGLDSDSGAIMAVKQAPIGNLKNQNTQDKIQALELEIDILKQLRHKNIVRYIGTSRDNKNLNIFLEFVAGGSIAKLLENYGKFNETLIRLYTKQLLEGLEYLHSHNVIHRDIKGANILVDDKGVCKLADFGGSKKIYKDFQKEQQFNSLRGTPYWMAPEVIKQTGHGRFADIWSVGCTVFEMATGSPPWSQYKNQYMALYHIGKAKKPPPYPKDLSPEAVDFLNLCFKQNAKERANVYKLLRHSFIVGNINTPNIDISLDILENKVEKNYDSYTNNNKNDIIINIKNIDKKEGSYILKKQSPNTALNSPKNLLGSPVSKKVNGAARLNEILSELGVTNKRRDSDSPKNKEELVIDKKQHIEKIKKSAMVLKKYTKSSSFKNVFESQPKEVRRTSDIVPQLDSKKEKNISYFYKNVKEEEKISNVILNKAKENPKKQSKNNIFPFILQERRNSYSIFGRTDDNNDGDKKEIITNNNMNFNRRFSNLNRRLSKFDDFNKIKLNIKLENEAKENSNIDINKPIKISNNGIDFKNKNTNESEFNENSINDLNFETLFNTNKLNDHQESDENEESHILTINEDNEYNEDNEDNEEYMKENKDDSNCSILSKPYRKLDTDYDKLKKKNNESYKKQKNSSTFR